jgi:hypothetical protein
MISPEGYRKSVVESLNLASSVGLQVSYQAEVPNANVVGEIFCQWEEIYFPEVPSFEIAFVESERIALAKFEELVSEIADSLGEPSLESFHQSEECAALVTAAKSTLAALGEICDDAD